MKESLGAASVGVDAAMWSTLQYIAPLILLSVSIPLAFLAYITTILALITLLVRVCVVYLQLSLALMQSWLLASPQRPRTKPAFDLVSGNTGLSSFPTTHKIPSRSESHTSLIGVGVPNRDFEGLGGWRIAEDGQDDAIWLGLNARLELQAPGGEKQRRHKRSVSSQSQMTPISPGGLRISPMQSRNRTPSEARSGPDGYFSIQNSGNTPGMSPEESMVKNRMEARRRSIGSSSVSSTASGKV